MIPGRIDKRTGMMLAAALVAPSIAIGLARFMPVGPASASASTGTDPAEPPSALPSANVAAVEYSPAQRAMMSRAALANEAGVSESPFRISDDDEFDAPFGEIVEYDDSSLLHDDPPFRLSSIIAGRRTVAIIDGVACLPGASLGNGWTVAVIDARDQTVLIRHRNQGECTLLLREP